MPQVFGFGASLGRPLITIDIYYDTHAGRTLVDVYEPELVKISSGQLFAVRAGAVRTARECMYALCSASFIHVLKKLLLISYKDATRHSQEGAVRGTQLPARNYMCTRSGRRGYSIRR